MAHLYISATHKSSGKTTISIGLCRELRRLGYSVQPFKKGPDYIDPLWLAQASGSDCLNLDFHTMEREEILNGFSHTLARADIGLIEGNVGLFDSVDLAGAHSNAEMAKLLSAPLILVVDAQGMSRGIAPLLLGYVSFDPGLQIAGVIASKVGGTRHQANLRRAVEHFTDIPFLGAIERDPRIEITERHIGLIPSNETEDADLAVERIRASIAEQVDIERILEIARTAAQPLAPPSPAPESLGLYPDQDRVRIAIARDDAFGFYYPDDLAALTRAGSDLVSFSPVRDTELPQADGLLLGGGFPEYRLRELAENWSMRAAILDFVESGGPAYAECGGLMYLCRELHWGNKHGTMCGVLNADVAMHERPQGRGYVRLRKTEAFPWPDATGFRSTARRVATRPIEVRAHEFHHSAVAAPDPEWTYGYEVLRGTGIDGKHDGIVHKNLLAAYTHLRDVGGNNWTRRFIEHVRACRR